jgi:hypothetical protein
MGVRLSGEGVKGELLLLLTRDGVEGVVGRLGLVVFGYGDRWWVSSVVGKKSKGEWDARKEN